MDSEVLGKEAFLEVARESLIAISYYEPEKIRSSIAVDNLNSVDGRVVVNGEGTDEFRSKLISISYLQSPDIGLIIPNGHA